MKGNSVPVLASKELLAQYYAQYAPARFTKRGKRTYIWGRWSRWFSRAFDTSSKVVLDFGSGGGGDGSGLLRQYCKQNAGKMEGYLAFDTDLTIHAWLEEKGYFYDFWKDDSRLEQIDMIIGNQIYEHLTIEERIQLVRRSFQLLKPGGLLILTYPFILYNMNFPYFWEDVTHKPVGVEAEAALIGMFGFDTEVFVGGLKGDPFGLMENFICLVRNLILFFPPFWLVTVRATKHT